MIMQPFISFQVARRRSEEREACMVARTCVCDQQQLQQEEVDRQTRLGEVGRTLPDDVCQCVWPAHRQCHGSPGGSDGFLFLSVQKCLNSKLCIEMSFCVVMIEYTLSNADKYKVPFIGVRLYSKFCFPNSDIP